LKVPHVTIWFWIAKCCATTVGETVSDFFNLLFDPCQCTWKGLGYDAILFFPLLFLCLYWNFRLDYYHPALYWGAIVLCSICGTIVTDGFHDNLGVMLWIEILVFTALMTANFWRWYAVEKSLNIHSVNTLSKELFYWGTVIWTFALGTAVGDCTATQWGLAFAPILGFFAAVTFGVLVTWVSLRYFEVIKKDDSVEVTLFWAAYIMTRPLGASAGDMLGSSKSAGGLGFGVGWTSLLFAGIILMLVLGLMHSKVDIDKDHIAVSNVDTEVSETNV